VIKGRNYAIDYLKAISIILVIITYCGWFNVDNYYPYTASHIKHLLMIIIVDMAVPIFMIFVNCKSKCKPFNLILSEG
jgi:surface polysaccharide O-acyltransferase-like enzyme